MTVVIIGGGLSGLTAAAHLAERGLAPLVLEANQTWLGGRLAGGEDETFSYGGRHWSFPSEHGIHGLWGGYVNMRETLSRFISDECLHPQPSDGEAWINRWGETVRSIEAGTAVRSNLIPAPFHYMNLLLRPRFWGAITPLDFLSTPGLIYSILWSIGIDPIHERATLRNFTLDDYYRLWTPNMRATIEGVARNMLAAPDEAITVSGLIAALRFYTLLRRDDWHPHFFPANIRTTLIDPLEEAVTRQGGRVVRGETVTRLTCTENGWCVHANYANGVKHHVDAEQVIMAVQPNGAKTILHASDDTRSQAESIHFPGVLRNAVVRLWFSRDVDDPAPSGMFTGDFVPDNYFWLHRIHREYVDWEGSAVELHFYGNALFFNQSDRSLQATALNEINRAFPELRGHFVHGAVRWNSQLHTAFEVMTDDMLHVDTPWSQVFACGDWIGYDSPALWMERACITGIAAANRVLEANGKMPYPILAPNPPEMGVRVLSGGVRGLRALFTPLIDVLRRLRQ